MNANTIAFTFGVVLGMFLAMALLAPWFDDLSEPYWQNAGC